MWQSSDDNLYRRHCLANNDVKLSTCNLSHRDANVSCDIVARPSASHCRPKSLLLDASVARHRHVTKKLRTLSLSLLLSDRLHGHLTSLGARLTSLKGRCAYVLHNNPLYANGRTTCGCLCWEIWLRLWFHSIYIQTYRTTFSP
jgi:hypothetical protein